MTTEFYIYVAGLALVCFYAAVRLRFELQMMQQNSYRTSRYLRWLRTDHYSTARVVALLMALVVAVFSFTRWGLYATGAIAVLALYQGIRGLRIKYKKPLVFTARAIRIFVVGLILLAAVVAISWILWGIVWALFAGMALAALSPLWIIAAVVILMPVERAINRRYIDDARRILRSMPRLTVIGITGSYGKTSTKHYLYRILSEKFSVVMTPGSFNTTLGVVRTIREHLKPFHEVFIVEMGAKQPGDIAEICDLVHPSIGIITAVGEQHLESFKTIENVQRTKFELADALPHDGVAILNDDFEYIADRRVTNVERIFRYTSGTSGATNKADYRVTDVKYGRDETTFRIETPDGGKTEPFTTKLAGIHNLSNILAGYIAGKTLGMTEAEMRYAIGGIEQVEHRLNIKHTSGGITVIDDAFNSNPHGAAMALDVLAGFTDGRRIVVTPGMIELGAKQEHYNREFGKQLAEACDIAVVVGEYNRNAILAGFAEGKAELARGNISLAENKTAVAVATFADASRHIREMAKPGDTILYENDLPDTFK
uniref:UDP-N-acetylmuramoyl-tripeptide-D-alanyl-D-alanine ligase n=1 Tax=uncultured bacterium contig00023(2014) TaxID=1465628 RepID=A0A060CWK1_9BACT|nr:UDP-N-acetylmuramoyl-tripeptide-D-alanyl-D-alanine ligase [uncultured bacterium contig00023(2014)]